MDSRPTILPNIFNTNMAKACHKNVNGMPIFFALIGDHRSTIITLGNLKVSMCPSINPTSIALCMDWKCGKRTSFYLMIKTKSYVMCAVDKFLTMATEKIPLAKISF